MIKRHTRPNPSKNIKGGIVDKEGPMQISNVLLICPACDKHTRVGHTKLARRHQGARLPPLQHDVSRLVAGVEAERRDGKPNTRKIPQGSGSRADEALRLQEPMAVPRVAKVTVNIGLGEASQNVKLLDMAAVELGQIAGQKPVITRAKKSIANFKIRKGMPIGCWSRCAATACTSFWTGCATSCFPRVRDFKGLPPNAFDGRGNYTLGLKDQLVFPEIDYTRVDKIKGMNITMTTTARNDEEGRELLKLLGVPFRAQGAA